MAEPAFPRVGLVLGSSAGGVGRHVRSLVEGLGAEQVAVSVAGPAATLHRFGLAHAAAGVRAVEIGPRPRPLADTRAVVTLRRWSRGVDVVHAHGMRAGALCALALGRRTRRARPLVVSLHNRLLGSGLRAVPLAAMERLVARRADVVLGASDDLVDRARRLGARDARLAPVAAPALPQPARSREQVREYLAAVERPLVLAVGRIATQKDYPTLVEAVRRWAGREPTPLTVVAGAGDERLTEALRDSSRGLPLRWLGARTDIADLLAAADVLVMPSLWEARSLVVQEAMRSGVPVVATRTGGLVELVEGAGVLVEVGDAAGLAAAVTRLLDDPIAAQASADEGRRRSADWPTEADTVRQLAGLYRELRPRRPRAGGRSRHR